MTTATLTRTDEQIRNHVLAELKWDPQVQANEIGVCRKRRHSDAHGVGRLLPEEMARRGRRTAPRRRNSSRQ
jgi:hypothetical protein